MKVKVELKQSQYNAIFSCTEVKSEDDDYGNKTYLDIKRDGYDFAYLDCRYITNYNEEEVFIKYLKDYFKDNLLNIIKIED